MDALYGVMMALDRATWESARPYPDCLGRARAALEQPLAFVSGDAELACLQSSCRVTVVLKRWRA